LIDLEETYAGKKALVTGGLGFIGSNLARRLAELSVQVTVIDALLPEQGGNYFNLEGTEGRIEVREGDIGELVGVEGLLEGRDFVFNLAAMTSHVGSVENPLMDLGMNCRSHLQFLEVLREVNRDCVMLYTGSRSQYGKAEYLPADEEHPFDPVDINGVHMTTVEMYHKLYSEIYGMPCVRLRITNVYGPRHLMSHSKQGFIHWFIRVGLSGGEIKVFGDGTQQRDFIYVGDCVEAMLQTAAEPVCYGKALNVGSGVPVSVLDCARAIAEKTGSSYRLIPFPEEYLNVETGDLYLDVSRMKELTGWEPAVGFSEGLDLTIDFYRRHWDKYWQQQDPAA
jgi:UDP-glucose 4-epimerase